MYKGTCDDCGGPCEIREEPGVAALCRECRHDRAVDAQGEEETEPNRWPDNGAQEDAAYERYEEARS